MAIVIIDHPSEPMRFFCIIVQNILYHECQVRDAYVLYHYLHRNLIMVPHFK